MNWTKFSTLFAFLAPLAFVVLAAIAVVNYPNYSPYTNFLSDLGAGENSAIFFNSATILVGFFAVLLAAGLFKIFGGRVSKAGSAILAIAGIFLMAVGIFPEGSSLHMPVSVAFFSAIALALIVFGIGARSRMGHLSALGGVLIGVIFATGIGPFQEHVAVGLIIVWSFGLGLYLFFK